MRTFAAETADLRGFFHNHLRMFSSICDELNEERKRRLSARREKRVVAQRSQSVLLSKLRVSEKSKQTSTASWW